MRTLELREQQLVDCVRERAVAARVCTSEVTRQQVAFQTRPPGLLCLQIPHNYVVSEALRMSSAQILVSKLRNP